MVRGYVVSRRSRWRSLLNHRVADRPYAQAMEAFFVVVLAAAVLGVGVLAVMMLSRMRKKMDRPDSQER